VGAAPPGELPRAADVLVVGAGIVGTAIAARLAAAGLDVTVVDRAGPGAGTSSSGEGDLLVSDKLPGPELALALRGIELWRQFGERAGGSFEFEEKSGLVVAHDENALEELWSLAREQRAEGVKVDLVAGDELHQFEPALSRELLGGAVYAEDCQVQPMLAVAAHVSEVVRHGGRVIAGAEVLRAERDGNGAISAVVTSAGTVVIGGWVVNAAGPWAGDLARRLGAELAVAPRRGHVLVTEPLPPLVRRKVFEASYVGSVHQGDAERACSSVIEATAGGTMLLGSSRESVGFSYELDAEVVAIIARRAIGVVPALAGARLMRAYVGFRPATPDRLPIIGADPRVGRLLHATGHEGAGVGLALVTADLVESLVRGEEPSLDIAPFAPGRFPAEAGAEAAARTGWARPSAGPWAGAGVPGGETPAAPAHEEAEETAAVPFGPVPFGPVPFEPVTAGSQLVRFRFDGRELTAPRGTTVAGALLANGEQAWRTTRAGSQRRGLFCGIGTCFDCLVDVNGEKAVRACLRPLHDGDEVSSSRSVGGPRPATGTAPGKHRAPKVTSVADVVVVGAGPAGMAAAAAAAARGATVVLVDASPRLGGQYFRQPLVDGPGEPSPAGPGLPSRFHEIAHHPLVELRLGRHIWSAYREGLGREGLGSEGPGSEGLGFTLRLDGGLEGASFLRGRAIVLATGASELTLPFPGWELPGVMTAGAAQALLKSQHVAVGRRVVVAGTGPFLLPVAATLAQAGTHVTVVEAAPLRAAPGALPGLVAHPAKLAEAAGYGSVLVRHGVRFMTGRAVVRCQGDGRAERAVVARLGRDWGAVAGSEQAIDVDAVCVSYGFVPRMELARQLGAGDLWRPGRLTGGVACDRTMASSTPGLFVAGEVAGIGGAEVAEVEGELAGHAAASYIGLPDGRPLSDHEGLARRLRKSRAFARGLEALYPLGTGWLSWLDQSTVVCRCEQATWGAVERAVAQGARSAREVRSLTRCGMGYCQGRTCGPALQLAISALTGRSVDRVGDLHKRPVAIPVPLSDVAVPAGAVL
jgi:D-hydroxyproline dehydrogenase subunit alpha